MSIDYSDSDIFETIKDWAINTYGRFYVVQRLSFITIMGGRSIMPHDCTIIFTDRGVVVRHHLTKYESCVILFSQPDFFDILAMELSDDRIHHCVDRR